MFTSCLSIALLIPCQTRESASPSDKQGAAIGVEIPRHYSHIRIASLGYSGLKIGPLEARLLRDSLDVVVLNPQLLGQAARIAPSTPRLIYSNCSNVYESLLLDWLHWADRHSVSRENAFYHAKVATPFKGDSPSSRPVNWFWRVYRGAAHFRELTADATGMRQSPVSFPPTGEALYLGYPERFAEINIQILSGAASGYSGVWEWSCTEESNQATSWRPLVLTSDTTSGLCNSGRIRFDPPREWTTADLESKEYLYYVRFRCQNSGQAPTVRSILGRDYVMADGKRDRGTIPVFDANADINHDGYLDDSEYSHRALGKDARFAYESRLFTDYYGPMRYATNISSSDCRRWLIDYHREQVRLHPGATGFFMDNSLGKPPMKPASAVESTVHYPEEYGRLLNDIQDAVSPWWLMPNTAGGQKLADEVVRRHPVYFEEFLLRPLSHNFNMFEDTAALVERRSKLASPPPYAFLDTHPQRGDRSKADPLDPRTQLAALAYYYLLADPERTFLLFFAGFEPGTAWQRHWCEAAVFDIGHAKSRWKLFGKGADPSDAHREFRVYQREYERALVLYKPLSYQKGVYTPVPLGNETATVHSLQGNYKPLQADGKLGSPTSEIKLRNGEGAILIKLNAD